ncbi:MAG: hypothetical protein GY868_06405 [Deltaproteobacteria bacterium]|nr:hypothetical protein [Deltaproteobacteria bacterium]
MTFFFKSYFWIVLFVAFFLGGIILIENNEQERTRTQVLAMAQNKVELVDKILQLKGSSLEVFLSDYKSRPEILRFMVTEGKQPLRFVLEEALPSFAVDAVWIYRRDFTLSYSANRRESSALRSFPVTAEQLRRLYAASDAARHFFILTPAGLMEVRTAPIRPAADRAAAPGGYLFVGRLWTPAYLAELEELSSASMAVVPASAECAGQPYYDRNRGSVSFTKRLPGINAEPFKCVRVSYAVPLAGESHRTSNQQLTLMFVFAAAILIFLSGFEAFRKWLLDRNAQR